MKTFTIFTDFDGVLHTGNQKSFTLTSNLKYMIDIITKLGYKVNVVVTSSWRLSVPHATIKDYLRPFGVVEVDFIDKNIAITTKKNKFDEEIASIDNRLEEIRCYVEDYDIDLDSFCIIDDNDGLFFKVVDWHWEDGRQIGDIIYINDFVRHDREFEDMDEFELAAAQNFVDTSKDGLTKKVVQRYVFDKFADVIFDRI